MNCRPTVSSLIAAGLIGVLVNTTCEHADASPPNIVLIVADDQNYSDFGFMENSDVWTPHIDRLARQSARYPNGYVPSSVCRPSLVSLLTGLYPHQHGVYFNHPPPGFAKLTKTPAIGKAEFDGLRQQAARLIRAAPALPRELAKRGYRCLQTGKYWEGHYRNAGFTDGMTIAQPSGGKHGDKVLANGDLVAHGNGDHGLAIGRETMQPIDDFLDDVGETPFFIWYAPFLPHTPHDAPRKYVDRFADSTVPKHRIPYYASIAQFDDTVGHLVGSIERRKLAENTVFVFVVDNGWTADPDRFVEARQEWDHTKRSKRSPFDDGLRTPILIRWDGQTRAATHPQLVSSIDIVPTLLFVAGIDIEPLELPGLNLLPSAKGESDLPGDRAVFGEIYPGDATRLNDPAGDIAYRWVRRGALKLIVPHSRGGQPPWNRYLTAPALFDVVKDPKEQTNLIQQPGYQTVTARLQTLLDEWWSLESVR